jgi:hypothetical protein
MGLGGWKGVERMLKCEERDLGERKKGKEAAPSFVLSLLPATREEGRERSQRRWEPFGRKELIKWHGRGVSYFFISYFKKTKTEIQRTNSPQRIPPRLRFMACQEGRIREKEAREALMKGMGPTGS